jgi:hypothetical protein
MKTPPSAIMPAARTVAEDPTREVSAEFRAAGLTARDPLDVLVDRVRPMAATAVDPLQVAAALEADGLTDRIARVQYGYGDVFVLAAEVHRRAAVDHSAAAAVRRISQRSVAGLRDIGHGLLYLLPAAVFPAVLAVVGQRSLLLGLLVAGGIGWIWAGTAAWLAYRLLGRRHPGGAGRLLRWAAFCGLPVTAAASLVVIVTTGAGYGLLALAVGQMAYQMASNILVFYRREGWLLAAMLPAVVAGLGYVVLAVPAIQVAIGAKASVRDELTPWAVAIGIASVLVTFGLALGQTAVRKDPSETRMRDGLRGELRMLLPVVAYTALSAAYLLAAQAPYILSRADVAFAVLPLIIGMGVVEWRARRFGEQARALLHRVRYPAQFVPRVWLLLAGGFLTCVVLVAALATGLLYALRAAHRLSPASTMMALACVTLAGAYYLGFLLANMGRYGWLCTSLGLCLAGHAAGTLAAPGLVNPLVDTTLFLASTVLLVVLFLIALSGRIGEARYHR